MSHDNGVTSGAPRKIFEKKFTGDEPLVRGFLQADVAAIPLSVYPEMALVAGIITSPGETPTRLLDFSWQREASFPPGETLAVHRQNEHVSFNLGGGSPVATCRLAFDGEPAARPPLDLSALAARCRETIGASELYGRFGLAGIQYQHGFQVLVESRLGDGESLARYALGPEYRTPSLTLNPALIEAVFQAAAALVQAGPPQNPLPSCRPVLLAELERYGSLPAEGWIHVTATPAAAEDRRSLTAVLTDMAGSVLLRIEGLQLEVRYPRQPVYYFTPVWRPIPRTDEQPAAGSAILVFTADDADLSDIRVAQPQWRWLSAAPGKMFKQLGDDSFQVKPGSEASLQSLLRALAESGTTPAVILQNHVPASDESEDERLAHGIEAMFHMVKAALSLGSGNRLRFCFLFANPARQTLPEYAALTAFFDTIHVEKEDFSFRLVEVARREAALAAVLPSIMDQFAGGPGNRYLRLGETDRHCRALDRRPLGEDASGGLLQRRQGVYLITGGAGGLGFLLACHLAESHKARLVLIGRSSFDKRIKKQLKTLKNLGGEALYLQAEVADEAALASALARAREKFAGLNGIFHCAGVLEDKLFFNKKYEEFQTVLRPKRDGIRLLDRLTAEDRLDCFVIFSSAASLIGNPGQSDYAFANGYLDFFAEDRQLRVARGERHGATLALNWPLWRDGGMSVAPEILEVLYENTGIVPLRSDAGLAALEAAVDSGLTSVMPLVGDEAKIHALLGLPLPQADRKPTIAPAGVATTAAVPAVIAATAAAPLPAMAVLVAPAQAASLGLQTERHLAAIVAAALGEDAAALDVAAPFQEYGVDSFLTLKILRALEKDFGKLPKTLLFENYSIRDLTAWFLQHHGPALNERFGAPAEPARTDVPAVAIEAAPQSLSVAPTPRPDIAAPAAAPALGPRTETYLAAIIAAALGEQPGAIDSDAPFQEYGVDSFLTLKILRNLEKDFGKLPKTLLFENYSLKDLTGWFLQHHAAALSARFGAAPVSAPAVAATQAPAPTLASVPVPAATVAATSVSPGPAVTAAAPAAPVAPVQREPAMVPTPTAAAPPAARGADVAAYLADVIAAALGEQPGGIDHAAPFQEYGVDSFLTLKILRVLEKEFGKLPKTLLFENYNLQDLTGWFLEHRAAALAARFAPAPDAAPALPEPVVEASVPVVASPAPSPPAPSLPVESASGQAIIPSREPAAVPGESTPAPTVSAGPQPIIIHLARLAAHPDLQARVQYIFDHHKKEASVSRGTRDIAPWLFLGERGYFNINRSGVVVLAYAYTGPDDAYVALVAALARYCAAHDFQLSIITETHLDAVEEFAFTATPFGITSRIPDMSAFTLNGNRMRRLRYLVSKFEKLGECRTEEYRPGTDAATDAAILAVIDAWCAGKTQVNPLIYKVKDEIAGASVDRSHRIFTTWLDGRLQNAILITEMQGGYLMDLEFYGPDMPFGGLEFAISNIVFRLAGEGHHTYSLGGTYGPRPEEVSPNPDPQVLAILEDLRERDDFGQGNFQFKNKFRTENVPVYLCRPPGGDPDTVTDILMMIADPEMGDPDEGTFPTPPPQAASTSAARLTEPRAPSRPTRATSVVAAARVSTPAPAVFVPQPDNAGDRDHRLALLQRYGFNPANVPHEDVPFDLLTDSWRLLKTSYIDAHMAELQARAAQTADPIACLREIFPFEHIFTFRSGREAESGLAPVVAREEATVPQNLLFPTWIFQMIEKGMNPVELPVAAVFDFQGGSLFKGDIDLDALEDVLQRKAGALAFICIELGNNASGGYPVSLENLRRVRELATRAAIPLVIDATRMLENACFIADRDRVNPGRDPFEVARELLACGDFISASLCKDFSTNIGGIVATNDAVAAGAIRAALAADGAGLDEAELRLVATAVRDKAAVTAAVRQRMNCVRLLWEALDRAAVPVLRPAPGHCVLIDVARLQAFQSYHYPLQSFLAWLFLHTGIRAGVHNAGMQRNSPLNQVVRLAVPTGITREMVETMIPRLTAMFATAEPLPDLVMQEREAGPFGEVHALFAPVETPAQEPATVGADADRLVEALPAAPVAKRSHPDGERADIAIIGISGRYPLATDLTEFWQNIAAGRDCISETPGEEKGRRIPGAKALFPGWGGYLDDIGLFDNFFFNVSPKEAENMDPQERLFLEIAWQAIEDAGYYPESLTRRGRDIGVFVGAVWTWYQVVGADEIARGNVVNPNSLLWSISNRVSYFMDLTGPSMTVDTACSSSLTAIHLACESIRRGECRAAIAGGVNIESHYMKRVLNQKSNMMARDGRCRSFGKGGTGYVPGEGVGALLLKPLADARRDGDHVYGVILATGANHGGRASGFSVPNPNAQASLVADVLHASGIDARSVGYIEAHGTGTELGDPIEIKALSEAFKPYRVGAQTCPIGSVKSNIGHLEAAAGIAGISKLLLQMKHGVIAPSLHSSDLNPYIDFNESPFFVPQTKTAWLPLSFDGRTYPLRAGLSSFGAGGANIHLLVEAAEPVRAVPAQTGPDILVFSARSEERLRALALRLRDFLAAESNQAAFADIAFTLKQGRQPMDWRLAFISADRAGIVACLSRFLEGKREDLFIGNAKLAKSRPSFYSADEKEVWHTELFANKKPAELAALWAEGGFDSWQWFRSDLPGQRTSLPGYPFEANRHWIKTTPVGAGLKTAALHPLLDANASNAEGVRFTKSLDRKDDLTLELELAGKRLPPLWLLPEMARAAGALFTGRQVRGLNQLVWRNPAETLEAAEHLDSENLVLRLFPDGEEMPFELAGVGGIYGQGKLAFDSAGNAADEQEKVDLSAFAAAQAPVSGDSLYRDLAAWGLRYGRPAAVLDSVHPVAEGALGRFQLPLRDPDDLEAQPLHAGLLQAAVQTALAHQLGQAAETLACLPVSLQALSLKGTLGEAVAVSVVALPGGTGAARAYDARFCDAQGNLLVSLEGLVLAAAEGLPGLARPEHLLIRQEWVAAPLAADASAGSGTILVLDSDRHFFDELAEHEPAATRILVRPGEEFSNPESNSYKLDPANAEDFGKLAHALKQADLLPQHIIVLWGREPYSGKGRALEPQLARGPYAMLYLVQALMEQKPANKIRLYFAFSGAQAQPQFAGLTGLFRTIHLENPRYLYKTLYFASGKPIESFYGHIRRELAAAVDDGGEITYRGDERFIKLLRPYEPSAEISGLPLKPGGVYLVTGGLGGLGIIFSRYLAERFKARLVLTGRSRPGPSQHAKIEELKALGAEVLYHAADVAKPRDVTDLIAAAKKSFGRLDGILHSAGVNRDAFIIKKVKAEMDAVFAAKIFGTANLDQATRKEPLDFFVVFSSLAGTTGNAGQGDYSYANAFLDGFAERREQQRAQKQREGMTISIAWPFWASGGMSVSEEDLQIMARHTGLLPMPTEAGLEAFAHAFPAAAPQFGVCFGEPGRMRPFFLEEFAGEESEDQDVGVEIDLDDLRARAGRFLKEMVGAEIGLDPDKIDADQEFEDFGIDSIMINQFNFHMEEALGPLSKTLLFEYLSIAELTDYFCSNYRAQLVRLFNLAGEDAVLEMESAEQERASGPWPRLSALAERARYARAGGERDIAIIGLAGRYAFAEDMRQFWDNFRSGRDCISEIPESRWDWRAFFDPDPEKAAAGKVYAKWGSFVADVDLFDPLFFKILPADADAMDPQERLFLETAWATLEDAGYSLDRIRTTCGDGKVGNVGVFAGSTTNTYNLIGPTIMHQGKLQMPASMAWTIANRVSYTFNFRGPSMPVDTACSSSLVAIHLACESLRAGECGMALAGGVNLYLHPSKYQGLARVGMLSSDGRCKSFGAGGDGFVPGEGVGAVLLKPLSAAVADGDNIYAVIKGTAINHGGKTNGFYVPNPNAQAAIIADALKNADLDARTISYIEAHGTGTELGDPIEISGLTKAFRENTADRAFCAVGSAKSNIGHLESAAGIAGLTKILLQMKYGQLAPSLHAEQLNPKIDFENSPFFVNRDLRPWDRPTIVRNGGRIEVPRRAGVSSFGAGGANAHIVLEEYRASTPPAPAEETRVFILSARDKDRLAAYASRLLDFLNTSETAGVRCDDLAFTLQTGREAMVERLAILARDIRELTAKLASWIAGERGAGLYQGNAKQKGDRRDTAALLAARDWQGLASAWVAGNDVAWPRESGKARPRPLPLPTYPFARERYWVPEPDVVPQAQVATFMARPKPPPMSETAAVTPRTCLYFEPHWQPGPVPQAAVACDHLLVFDRLPELAEVLRTRVANGGRVIRVRPGRAFSRPEPDLFEIDAGNEDDYRQLLATLARENCAPRHVLHRWSQQKFNENADLRGQLRESVYSLFHLVRTLLETRPKHKIRVVHLHESGASQPVYAAVAGLCRTVCLESTRLDFKTVDLGAPDQSAANLAPLLLEELSATDGIEVRYRDGNRQLRQLVERRVENGHQGPLAKEGGVYLITGGAGGLGLVFARHLARQARVKLVLTGRSPLNESIRRKIEPLFTAGAEVIYHAADVADQASVAALVRSVRARFGAINGVLHSAGVIRDALLQNKTTEQMDQVLSPKVWGTCHLDRELADEKLDFFVLFSALAGALGNPGQADYAYANTFMDHFAEWRERAREAGLRFGVTRALDWPLWRDGGMHISAQEEELLAAQTGMSAMPTGAGTAALEAALAGDAVQNLVIFGEPARIRGFIEGAAAGREEVPSAATGPVDEGHLLERTIAFLKDRLSVQIRIPAEKIDSEVSFEDYGIDSLLINQLNLEMEKIFGHLPKTLLFEYRTVAELAAWFAANQRARLLALLDLAPSSAAAAAADEAGAGGEIGDEEIVARARDWFKATLSEQIRIPVERIDAETPFEEFGIDSLLINQINLALEKTFGYLPKTLLFEYPSVAELVSYFLTNQRAQLAAALGLDKAGRTAERERPATIAPVPAPAPAAPLGPVADIAIIGVAGRYPGAPNVAAFWENLRTGVDAIDEVPADRWDWRAYYDPDPKNAAVGKIYCKWGGFLDGVDLFDPLFFKISPREAETLDPQERLFLETAWQVIEDAGYTLKDIARAGRNGKSGDVGVFTGVTTSSYNLLGPTVWKDGRVAIPSANHWSLANRVSYTFNFNGPSMPVDTACSSSLTAVHLACESIKKGECSLAIAGGVNLYLHPAKIINLCQAGMLSASGRCHTFGADSDGFVPGEGVGAVLLKSLADAERDGDRIYAVIKGSVLNHGGRTQGFSVPNPNAQAQVIADALAASGIDARTISYVEAQGTATDLGDPIEVAGLTRAFRAYTRDSEFCGLGSVKSNIGNLEAAGGIAGLTKTILQMKHRRLVPSLHTRRLNPKIDFMDSPFYVVRSLQEWEQPVIELDGRRVEVPRRAGVSNFGAGGANAHLILEEYTGAAATSPTPAISLPRPCLVPLAAQNENRLRAYAGELVAFLAKERGREHRIPSGLLVKLSSPAAIRGHLVNALGALLKVNQLEISEHEHLADYGVDATHLTAFAQFVCETYGLEFVPSFFTAHPTIDAIAHLLWEKRGKDTVDDEPAGPPLRLADLAYTLQVGRATMPARLACVAHSVDDLLAKLKAWLDGDAESCFCGNTDLAEADREKPSAAALRELTRQGALADLARHWTDGAAIDWPTLYPGGLPAKISLPTYPFARKSYWILEKGPRAIPPAIVPRTGPGGTSTVTVAAERTAPVADPLREPGSKQAAAPSPQPRKILPAGTASVKKGASMQAKIEHEIQKIIAKILKIDFEDMNNSKSFGDFGFDSLGLKEMAEHIGRRFGLALPAAVLYVHNAVGRLAEHLLDEYGEEIEACYASGAAMDVAADQAPVPAAAAATASAAPVARMDEIAIIGAHGLFPNADTLDAFWQVLLSDASPVTEIPADRWDWREYYGDPDKERNKTDVKWGAFVRDVDKFDSLFFGISPREAALMDPQQRLFLETSWKAFEDAGYKASDLAGSRTGVFAGVSPSEYQSLADREMEIDGPLMTGMSGSMVVNRISFFLDLKGPSELVDTACSSSLVALHRAVSAIRSGECDLALAGGVSLILGKRTYIGLTKVNMLARDGVGRPFDKRAAGYVRGEGSAAVVLKPLHQAIADGDHIYGVIKSTAVNHGGRANTMTSPNPHAQAELLRNAWQRAGIDPNELGYIEAAANGSDLGDQLEAEGLKMAYKLAAPEGVEPVAGACKLGTLKGKIGNLDTASGVAALIKVLLAMKHGRLPGNANLEEPNPFIRFKKTPFALLMGDEPWPAPRDGSGNLRPRLAGISSFGFGGVNAHVVIAEHLSPKPAPAPAEERVFVLSARNRERLTAYAGQVAGWLDGLPAERFADFIHTFQVGREPMEERLAIVALDGPALAGKLRAFVAAGQVGAIDGAFGGNTKTDKDRYGFFLEGEEGADFIGSLIRNRKLAKLADVWASGVDVDWSRLYPAGSRRRISAPTYPFKRASHWIAERPVGGGPDGGGQQPEPDAATAAPAAVPPVAAAPPAAAQAAPQAEPVTQAAAAPAPAAAVEPVLSDRAAIRRELLRRIAGFLWMDEADIATDTNLADYGFDSFTGTKLINDLQETYGFKISIKVFFEHRTIDELAAFLEKLERRAPLAATASYDGAACFPLSEAQKAVWFMHQMQPDTVSNHLPISFAFARPVDAALLGQAFDLLVERHPVLRTTFLVEDGHPRQMIHQGRKAAFRVEDFSGRGKAEVDAWLNEHAAAPFDLDNGPLMRATLIKRGAEKDIILLVLHHIVFDGVSFTILFNDLNAIYKALAAGHRPELPPLPATYGDFVAWQRSMLDSPEGVAHGAYWDGKLTGRLPVLSLPADYPRGVVQKGHGKIYRHVFDAGIQEKARAFVRQENSSQFMFLLAAFKILLGRYTQETDIIVGTPVAARPEKRFQTNIGYFINMIPLRDDLSRPQTFRSFLEGVKQTALEALDHGSYPFQTLVERLNLPKSQDNKPVFQVCFVLQNMLQGLEPGILSGEDTGTGLRFEYYEAVRETGGFDLTLEIMDEEGALEAFFKYRDDLYSEDRIVKMAYNYQTLLENILRAPDALVPEISILSEKEQQQLASFSQKQTEGRERKRRPRARTN